MSGLSHSSARSHAVILAGLFLAALCGCAGTKSGPRETLFYPPPPQAPRIQYLTRYQTSADVGVTSGKFQKFVTGQEAPVVDLQKPHHAALWKNRIYVCDSRRGEVVVFDLAARSASILGGQQGFLFGKPLGIDIDDEGRKYIADNVNKRIYVFGADDQFQNEFGVEGQFGPTSLAVYQDRIYVADTDDKEVEVLDRKTGQSLKTIKKFKPAAGDTTMQLAMPANLAIDDKGWLYVSDMLASVVRVFDQDFQYQSTIGRPGDQLGTFGRPRGLAVDREGFVYVADAAFENIQVFSPAGEPVIFFGGPGVAPGNMYMPAGVSIQYEGLEAFREFVDERFALEYVILVTNQFAPNGVSVYGFGHGRDGVVPPATPKP